MEQKTIWMPFLIIGISVITVCLVCSCSSDTDYFLRVDFVLINGTDNGFTFVDIIDNHQNVDLYLSSGEHKIFIIRTDGADKYPNPQNCCQGLLDSVHGGHILVYTTYTGDTLCKIFRNDGPHLLKNYTPEILDDRHFRYTYTFTVADFADVKYCP